MTVSVCIPIYNESDAVENCAEQLYKKMISLKEKCGFDFEIIFCDDGSTDDCRAKAEAFARGADGVRVIGYDENRGKGRAVRYAVEHTAGDVVLFTDCDLAYGVDVIEDAVLNIADADILIGSRNLTKDGYDGYGAIRKFASKTYIKMLSAIGGLGVTDSQCGFKVFKGESAKKIFSLCECDGFAFDYEIILIAKKLGMKISEMPVSVRNHGQSAVHVISDSFSMIKDVFRIKKRVSRLDIPRGAA